jgi:hypothetical protein
MHLLRWHNLKSMRNLLLPPKPRLSINLRRRLKVRTNSTILIAEEDGVQDGQVRNGLLDVVGVDGAGLAEELNTTLSAHAKCADTDIWGVIEVRT